MATFQKSIGFVNWQCLPNTEVYLNLVLQVGLPLCKKRVISQNEIKNESNICPGFIFVLFFKYLCGFPSFLFPDITIYYSVIFTLFKDDILIF